MSYLDVEGRFILTQVLSQQEETHRPPPPRLYSPHLLLLLVVVCFHVNWQQLNCEP